MTDHGQQNTLNLDELAACVGDLYALGPDTEAEFLAIGTAVNDLAAICFGMTDDAVKLSTLADFSAGDNESGSDSFVNENAKIFDAVAGHIKTTLTSLNGGSHLLAQLLSQVKILREPIRKLQSIGKTFRVLGVAIKVESSRSREAMEGFTLLAGEVGDIAKLVNENCHYCIDKAELVEKDILSSQRVLNTHDNCYDDSGERAIHTILQSLEEIGCKSEQLAVGIQERSSVMVQGISDVVMAMQFHDITRQQLENVSAALNDTIEKAQSIPLLDTATQAEQVILEIYSILSIQAAHLNSIYEQIFSARKNIETGLGKTIEQARMQAKDAKMLLELEGRVGNSSVVTDLEMEIDNIIVSLNKSLAVVKQAADVSREVYGNVSEIGVFVNKIEEISFDVKILAINAMIEALKTGAVGNALIVLAKELSALSQETHDSATDSIEMLNRIVAGTEAQMEFSVNLDKNSVAVDEMIARAKECAGTILSSLQVINKLGQKMDSSSRDLAARILKLVPGIQFPQVMGDRIDKNWQLICRTIDRIEDLYPQFAEGNSEVKKMLEELAKQYVMDRERSIHAQVTGGAAGAAANGDPELFEDDGFELF